MAIWQLSFDVVDKNKDSNDENIRSWDTEPGNVYDITFLDKTKSWGKECELYGNPEKTCIKLTKENDRVVGIGVKLDIRELSEELIENVIKYIAGIDGKIFYKNEILSPSISELKAKIVKSDAFRFCVNPREFFESLQK